MKKLTYITLFVLACLFSTTACERERLDSEEPSKGGNTEVYQEGQVNLASIKVAIEVAVGLEVETRAEVNTDNFIIRIFNCDDEDKLVKEWVYSEMPEVFTLKVGNYRVAAYSHEELPAEFDHPFYYGTQDFEITADNITQLTTLKCVLHSIMVTVDYDDELRALLGDDVKATVTVENGGTLDFAKGESRAGYFKAINKNANVLKTKLSGTIEGSVIEHQEAFSNIKAGEHRKIHYTLKSINENIGEGGSSTITIEIDATCTVEDIPIIVDPGSEEGIDDFPSEEEKTPPGSDDNDNEDGNNELPTIVGKDFNGSSFNIDNTLTVPSTGCTLSVLITAPKQIANLKVTIDSETLTEEILTGVGLALNFDLAYPGKLKEGLESLNFPTGENVIGQPEIVFDITDFTALLGVYGSALHNFIIEVTDQAGKTVSKTLKLKS